MLIFIICLKKTKPLKITLNKTKFYCNRCLESERDIVLNELYPFRHKQTKMKILHIFCFRIISFLILPLRHYQRSNYYK